jgi:hypothetical protein
MQGALTGYWNPFRIRVGIGVRFLGRSASPNQRRRYSGPCVAWGAKSSSRLRHVFDDEIPKEGLGPHRSRAHAEVAAR